VYHTNTELQNSNSFIEFIGYFEILIFEFRDLYSILLIVVGNTSVVKFLVVYSQLVSVNMISIF